MRAPARPGMTNIFLHGPPPPRGYSQLVAYFRHTSTPVIRGHNASFGELTNVAASNIRQTFHINTNQTPLLRLLAVRNLENIWVGGAMPLIL
jgi:hypothetical protein